MKPDHFIPLCLGAWKFHFWGPVQGYVGWAIFFDYKTYEAQR